MSLPQSEGYFATSKNNAARKVLVLHAWWGLNDTIRNYCDRLAEKGFTVYAPDLYHGKLTDEMETAETYSNELDLDQARIDLDQALEVLQDQALNSATSITVLGFSLGAFLALDLSNNRPDLINKVVVYYGTGPDDYTKATASYLGHFAEFDKFEPQSNIKELETALLKYDRPYTFHHYSNTGHWFCEPDRQDAYMEEEATLAWERTLSFLSS